MNKVYFFSLVFFSFLHNATSAQDTLPSFSLIKAGKNRVIIGWTNPYPNVRQISIQRSFDSLIGYKSILTVADPASVQNGYMDTRAPHDSMFYRIYIMLDKGMYHFTKPKRPVPDTQRIKPFSAPVSNTTSDSSAIKFPIPDSLWRVNPVVIRLNGFPVTDSVAVPNPVTFKKNSNTFTPSLHVYSCRDGYICIRLPEDEKPKKFTIRFYDKGQLLFELKDIKEKELKLDKTNFYHAGWFDFELYEDEKLLEKHKFFLEREF